MSSGARFWCILYKYGMYGEAVKQAKNIPLYTQSLRNEGNGLLDQGGSNAGKKKEPAMPTAPAGEACPAARCGAKVSAEP